MKEPGRRNLAASVRQRLLDHSVRTKQDFQVVLARYGVERLLYRLGRSPYAGQFTLKGALMFLVWTGEQYRPTRDMDLMSKQKRTAEELATVFRDICKVDVPDDGIVLPDDTVAAESIRDGDEYGGMRVTLTGKLGQARIPIRIDIGFCDAVTPKAVSQDFPALLDFAAPHIPMYPRETAIAEKFHTIVVRGVLNSRMKDYYDIWALCREFAFDGAVLSKAIAATFRRRKTGMPDSPPTGIADEFSSDAWKRAQWNVFIRRTPLRVSEKDLSAVVTAIRGFLLPPYLAAASGATFDQEWPKGGPWQAKTRRLEAAVADAKGLNAMLYAIHSGHAEVVETLVQGGANVNSKDSSGTSPMKLASTESRKDIVVLLTRAGAKL
jgi:hypothetical protein